MGIIVKRNGYDIQGDAAVFAALGRPDGEEIEMKDDVRDLIYDVRDEAAALDLVRTFLKSDLRQRGCWLELR